MAKNKKQKSKRKDKPNQTTQSTDRKAFDNTGEKNKHSQIAQSTDRKGIDSIENKNERNLEALKNEIDKKKDELQKKRSELERKEADKQGKIDSFSKKYEVEGDKLTKLIHEELEQAARKKNNEKNPHEAADAETKQKDLKKIQDTTFKSKLEYDINQIKKDIESKKKEIAQKEKEKKKTVYDSKSKSESVLKNLDKNSNQSGSEQKIILPVPSLPYLPKTGQLYQADGQDYLAIQDWEEYDEGEKEASRLNAKLCAGGGK
jgi:hypothetical protein